MPLHLNGRENGSFEEEAAGCAIVLLLVPAVGGTFYLIVRLIEAL